MLRHRYHLSLRNRQQVANANAARDNTSSEMDRMTEEFARRLGESENKLRTTAQDRDAIKRELNQALKDIQSKAALEAIVKEKEDLVQVNTIDWSYIETNV